MDFCEVSNGLVGMKRDIILRFCHLIWFKNREIRSVIGICHELFQWKSHNFFRKGRPKNIPIIFRVNPSGGYILSNTPTNNVLCNFTNKKSTRTLFLGSIITTGIYEWMVEIRYCKEGISQFYIGAAPLDRVRACDTAFLGMTVSETVSLYSQCFDGSISPSYLYGARKYNSSIDSLGHSNVLDESLVTAEVDCSSQTLCFFLNHKKIPRGFSWIRSPLQLGITGYGRLSFATRLFRRLPAITPSPVQCQYYTPYIQNI